MKHTYLTSSFAVMASLVAGMLTLSSCRQDLCYDHFRRSTVTLSYEREWERDYGTHWSSAWHDGIYPSPYESLRPVIPETVTMAVYPTNGEQSYQIYIQAAGAEVSLGAGPYDFLFYNNDTEYIVINDIASLPDATATTTTRSRGSLAPLHEGERTVSPPDVIYGAYHQAVPDVGVHGNTPIDLTLRPLVYTYVIRYEFSHGIDNVSLVRGALAGMAESVFLRDGSTGDNTATVLFDAEMTDWGALAAVRSFGVPSYPGEHYVREGEEGDGAGDYKLNLEVLLKNGKTQTFEFDVTDQLRNQPRGGVITVSGIDVEDCEDWVDSGFDVSVDDWGEWTDVYLPTTGVEIPE